MRQNLSMADSNPIVQGFPGEMPRPINVTMMGAGSFFTSSVLRDVVLIPGNQGGELRLCDIDGSRLALSHQLMEKIVAATGTNWKVSSSTDRKDVLSGSDYIINSIEVNGLECVRPDNDIPLEFGVSQCIGDTVGPGGLFKALRTIPEWIAILKDAERLCPNAYVLNYTNPMGMLCLAAARASSMRVVGLCHSVQGTSKKLAGFAGHEIEDVRWDCAGINHLAWFTRFEGPEGDLYPKLIAMANDRGSEFSQKEPVRSDMLRHFGAFITESSGHLSEYLPYYRKRKDLLDAYTKEGYLGRESFYADNWPTWRAKMDETRREMIAGTTPLNLARSVEYGAQIIESIEKDFPSVIYGNVAPNAGAITNLPDDGCIEVACLVNRNGVTPTQFGRLPSAMAAVCDSNMRFIEVATEAALTKSKSLAAQALLLDPLTSAVCCPSEIFEMTARIFAAEEEWLPGFH